MEITVCLMHSVILLVFLHFHVHEVVEEGTVEMAYFNLLLEKNVMYDLVHLSQAISAGVVNLEKLMLLEIALLVRFVQLQTLAITQSLVSG